MPRRTATKSPARRTRNVALAHDHSLAVSATPAGAIVAIRSASGVPQAEIEITITPQGPVIRTRAVAIEVEAMERVSIRCDEFTVDARSGIALSSDKDLVLRSAGRTSAEARDVVVNASSGGVVVRANDDVQLLGEQILLNCDREPEMPAWVPVLPSPERTLPVKPGSGDEALVKQVLGTPTKRR